MDNHTLQLNIQSDSYRNFRIFVGDSQVQNLCLGILMLQHDLIGALQLSPQKPLRILKLSKKLKTKWNVYSGGYATTNDSFIDIRLDDKVLNNWLIFYLKYHQTEYLSNVDHTDFELHKIRKNDLSIDVGLTFLGAGYTDCNVK